MKNLFVFLGLVCLFVATQATAQVYNLKSGDILRMSKDSANKIFHIHGKRGDNNTVTFENINLDKDKNSRDTYQHPEEPKTRLKIEPTPKVIKPKIIPLESH